MNTQMLSLTCALAITACGSASTRSAQDATSGTATTDQSNTAPGPQPVSATTDNTVDAAATGDNKANGANPYVATKSATPAVETHPSVADETKNADQTRTTSRERQNSLTPMDQGNSAAETKITANIRKGIMGDNTVSFTGKNVKVITVGTRVTLRGSVKNDQERTAIEGIAKRTAGVSDVENQLEVVN